MSINDDQIKIMELKIGKFHLGNGDYLVFRFPEDYPKEELDYVAGWFFDKFPELSSKALLIAGDIKIYVAHVGGDK